MQRTTRRRDRTGAWAQRTFAWYMARSRNSKHARYGQLKKSLFSPLNGTVLEIGPGVGDNLRYYPKHIKLIGLEPNSHMHSYLLAESVKRGIKIEIHQSSATAIEMSDDSVDCAVSTLVLCSVADIKKTLAEIRRVLRPGGHFFFIEHVAAPESTVLFWLQRSVRRPWKLIAGGCDTQQRTLDAIEESGFEEVEYQHRLIRPRCPLAPSLLIAPHIVGVATKQRSPSRGQVKEE